MTRKNAIENAIAILSTDSKNTEIVDTLNKILEGLNRKREPMSDEQKVIMNEKRRQASKAKRKEYVTPIIPILYDGLIEPMTAKELYAKVKDQLPVEFTAGKVQAILLSDMSDKVRKLTDGRNAMKYERI